MEALKFVLGFVVLVIGLVLFLRFAAFFADIYGALGVEHELAYTLAFWSVAAVCAVVGAWWNR